VNARITHHAAHAPPLESDAASAQSGARSRVLTAGESSITHSERKGRASDLGDQRFLRDALEVVAAPAREALGLSLRWS
jgi:hypothetical protein